MKKISASELRTLIDEETVIVIKEHYSKKEIISEAIPVAAWVGTALTTILSTETGRSKVADILDGLPNFLLSVCQKIDPDDTNPELGGMLRKLGKTFCKGAVYVAGGALFKILSKLIRSMNDNDVEKVAEKDVPGEAEDAPPEVDVEEYEDIEAVEDIDIKSLNPFLSDVEEETPINESRLCVLAGVDSE